MQPTDVNALIEEAEAYLSLQEKFGLSQEDIAGRVGKAPGYHRPGVNCDVQGDGLP